MLCGEYAMGLVLVSSMIEHLELKHVIGIRNVFGGVRYHYQKNRLDDLGAPVLYESIDAEESYEDENRQF